MPLLGKTVQEVLMARDTTSSFLSTSVMSSIENISVDSNRKNRVFGTDSRFSAFNIVTYPRKITKFASS